MFITESLTYWWYQWANLFAGLGLPWDKYTSAYLALGLVFWTIGYAFKVLIQK